CARGGLFNYFDYW
nr:immunoglobulin heavy chain junction region [Mus musculus]